MVKQYISPVEHLRRSEGAKRGWITRRRNMQMIRNVWGTACSDKNKAFSFTFYAFSADDLDESDAGKCEDKFSKLIDRWLRLQYPGRHYTFDNSEADGWFREMVRREKNQSVPHYKPDFNKWIFEINTQEDSRGELSEIVY